MLLTLDIGNTMAKFVFFGEEGKILHRYQVKTRPERSKDEYASSFSVFLKSHGLDAIPCEGAIISSVVPSLTRVFIPLIQDYFGIEPKVLGPGLKTGLAVRTDNPKEVGGDLIGDAIGAKAIYGHSVIIADLGTATKMVLLNDKGDFEGCTIAPGLRLGLEALVENTAALTDVSLTVPPRIIGKNTADSMNSGLLYATAFAIARMAEKIEEEAGYPCAYVVTGGYASYVKELLPGFVYEPDLCAKGLYETLLRNKRG